MTKKTKQEAVKKAEQFISIKEAAALLRVSRKALYCAVARDKVAAVRIGTAIRIDRAALLRAPRGVGRTTVH